LTVSSSSLFTPALLRTHSFVFFAVHETHRIFLSSFISKASRRDSSFFLSVQLSQRQYCIPKLDGTVWNTSDFCGVGTDWWLQSQTDICVCLDLQPYQAVSVGDQDKSVCYWDSRWLLRVPGHNECTCWWRRCCLHLRGRFYHCRPPGWCYTYDGKDSRRCQTWTCPEVGQTSNHFSSVFHFLYVTGDAENTGLENVGVENVVGDCRVEYSGRKSCYGKLIFVLRFNSYCFILDWKFVYSI